MDDFENEETTQQTNNVIRPFVGLIRFAGLLRVVRKCAKEGLFLIACQSTLKAKRVCLYVGG